MLCVAACYRGRDHTVRVFLYYSLIAYAVKKETQLNRAPATAAAALFHSFSVAWYRLKVRNHLSPKLSLTLPLAKFLCLYQLA